jgi:hypothetical protein
MDCSLVPLTVWAYNENVLCFRFNGRKQMSRNACAQAFMRICPHGCQKPKARVRSLRTARLPGPTFARKEVIQLIHNKEVAVSDSRPAGFPAGESHGEPRLFFISQTTP